MKYIIKKVITVMAAIVTLAGAGVVTLTVIEDPPVVEAAMWQCYTGTGAGSNYEYGYSICYQGHQGWRHRAKVSCHSPTSGAYLYTSYGPWKSKRQYSTALCGSGLDARNARYQTG